MSVANPSRIPVLLCAVVITAVAAAVFLTPEPALFPMDDTYIHVVYAENLAHTGRLEFNVGEFDGIGSTSILWVLAIALLVKVGLSGVVATKVLSVLCLFLTLATTIWLLQEWVPRVVPRCPAWLQCAIAVLAGCSGNIIWFGLSGMETLCFLGLALLALVFYARDNWVGVGIAAGLAALTRIEGGALMIALLATHFLAKPGSKVQDLRRLVTPTIIVLVLILPWLAYLYVTTGEWLPTSFEGKRLVQAAATHETFSDLGMRGFGQINPLVVLSLWGAYASSWVYGLGYGYPPAVKHVGSEIGGGGVDIWLVAVVFIVFVIVPLTVLGWVALWRARRRLRQDYQGRALIAFILWALLHNAAYAFFFPCLGTSSRYQAVNHILLWMIPLLGVGAVKREDVQRAAFASVAFLLAVNLIYWRGTYAANLKHMREVRFAAADWLAQTPGRAAAFDIGALRWRSGEPLVDLGGLSNADFVDYQMAGRVGEFLKLQGVTHLAIPCPHSQQAMPFELMDFLRLRTDPMFTPVEVARFEGSVEEWRRGFGPTFNYQPAVVIYEVRWNASPRDKEERRTDASPVTG